jgi:DNA-binding transcriptional MerR regulator
VSADLTIEELASRTGLSVRNIRSHRTNGLLPPPEVRNSIGYYGEQHLARLKLIKEMQAEGFNLQAIKRLIDATQAPQSVLGFRHVLFAPLDEQPSAIMTMQELLEAFGAKATPEVIARVVELGELVPLDDGRIEVMHPTLLEAVRELADQGMEVEPLIDVFLLVREHCAAVADAFVQLIVEGVLNPFAAEGYPQERWAEIGGSIGRLKPLASQVLMAIFQTRLAEAIEQRFGQELSRLAGSGSE